MKKICLLLAAVMILFSFAGCGKDGEETQPSTESTQSTVASDPSGETGPSETTVPPTTELPIVEVVGYDITLPEGFKASESETDRTVYESPNTPQDTSTVIIEIQDRNEDILEVDEEAFKELSGDQEYRKVTLDVIELDGIPTLFADYTVKEGSVFTHIYEYHVVASQNYMFRFADSTDDNQWLEKYAGAVNTIQMLLADEDVKLDYSGLEKYTLDCGISMYAAEGMSEQDAPGFIACLGSRSTIILMMRDNMQEHDLVGLTLEEYAQLVSQSNDLDPFVNDTYGNLSTSFYSTDDEGVEYYNYLTVKQTQDSFWVFQMTCAASHQASYDREFARWATSISEN